MAWFRWKPYVPVAKRRQQAARKMEALKKKGVNIQPVVIDGRKIAKTFWGEAWCDHLESFSDFENRLPRGRTYVRNGSVCHLAITKGRVEAKVSGSEIYNIVVKIKTLPKKQWGNLKGRCAGQIGSLLELLRGDLSGNVMEVVTGRQGGLFPRPGEIEFTCDCPDWASMCKHVAAVFYGVGARLDDQPALLFKLRGVDHNELIDAEVAVPTASRGGSKRLDASDLDHVFDIDLDGFAPQTTADKAPSKSPKKPATATRKAKKPTKATRATASGRATSKSATAKKTAATKTHSPKKKAGRKPSKKKATQTSATTAKGRTKAAPRKKTARASAKKKSATR